MRALGAPLLRIALGLAKRGRKALTYSIIAFVAVSGYLLPALYTTLSQGEVVKALAASVNLLLFCLGLVVWTSVGFLKDQSLLPLLHRDGARG